MILLVMVFSMLVGVVLAGPVGALFGLGLGTVLGCVLAKTPEPKNE